MVPTGIEPVHFGLQPNALPTELRYLVKGLMFFNRFAPNKLKQSYLTLTETVH